jgi:parallel beta-helix repeat protein
MLVRRAAACALFASLVAAPCALAGDLTPPGAPSSTMKALDVVEPRIPVGPLTTPGDADSIYRITQPGSYYLTGEVLGKAGFHGVQIEASDVSLDLMGFTVRGVAGARSGLLVSGGTRNGVAVTNGVFRDWPEYGCSMGSAEGAFASGLRLVANGFDGMTIRSGVVENCTARENGFGGFRATQATVFRGCMAEGNAGDGINAGITASVLNCAAILNGDDGIVVGSASSILGCASQQNAGDGYAIDFGSTLRDSGARSNTGRGVAAGEGSTIVNNSLDRNQLDGISVSRRSLVMNNTCSLNGNGSTTGAGILVTADDNRIEGNNLVGNDTGLDVNSSGNFIVRNTASGNATNWDIVASNRVGVIVSAPNSIAILGSTGGAGVGSTDPWANFSY